MSDPPRSAGPGANVRPEDTADPRAASRLEATVRGQVQGVGFRWFVSRAASRLELVGWVTNRRDGSVLLVAEGPDAALESLLAIVERGPAGAQVDHVEVRRSEATGTFHGFEIRSGSHPGD
jgi:acylphosphatase